MFGAIMALLSMTSCNNGNNNENVTSTLSFDEVLTSRRSVRNYDASKKITEAEVRDLIKAAQEAPYYVQTDTRLAAPLLNAPFTHGEIGVLMQKGQEDLLQIVNNVIRQMKSDGSLRKLHEKYGLVYAYE